MESLAGNLKEISRTPLAQSHVDALMQEGKIVDFTKGQITAEVGGPMDAFLYILEGGVEVIDPYTCESYLPTSLGPTQF